MNFSPIAAVDGNTRVQQIQLHGRQLANAYVLPGTRMTYSRVQETWLIAVLSGFMPTADMLATVDQIAQAYLYLEDVRQEVIRCTQNTSLTVNDFIDPDPNANRPYTRAAIWAGVPWQVRRTNRPIVSTDYALSETDYGVVMNKVGAKCTLPAYTDRQLGNDYGVKNLSTGDQTIQTVNGESIALPGSQLVSSVTIPSNFSRQLSRESSTQNWIIS